MWRAAARFTQLGFVAPLLTSGIKRRGSSFLANARHRRHVAPLPPRGKLPPQKQRLIRAPPVAALVASGAPVPPRLSVGSSASLRAQAMQQTQRLRPANS
jgi:hypothetical protein